MEAEVRNEWLARLRDRMLEIDRLSRDLQRLASDSAGAAGASDDPNDVERDELRFATARLMRHRMSIALVSSGIAAGSGS